jgi:type IVB pilus formation R64 PilN family outer membrane protein
MLKNTSLLLAILAISGCGAYQNVRDSDRKVETSVSDAETSLKTMQDKHSEQLDAVTEIRGRQYVNTTPMRAARKLPMPCKVTYHTAGGVSLLEASQTISKLCGLQVRVTQDAQMAINGTTPTSRNASGGAGGGANAAQSVPPPGVIMPPSQPGGMASQAQGMPDAAGITLSVDNIEGESALDQITSRYGLSWQVDRGTVVIFHNETRTYRIFNIPQALQSSSTITSGNSTQAGITGSGSGGAGGSGQGGNSGGVSGTNGSVQTSTLTLNTNPSADLLAQVNTMLSPSGQAYYSASTSTLVVTDTPWVLDRVDVAVNSLNDTYSKQVLVNAKILTVTVSDNHDYNLNWSLVWRDMANKYGIKLTNSTQAAAGSVTGAINILSGNPQWNGSQALVNALSTQGKVRVLTEPSIIARNMKSTPIQIARQTGYLAQSSNTITSGGGASGFSQTSLTPGTVTTGFNMMLTPSVYPDNKTIELQLTINLSDLVNILKEASGDSSIQVPIVDTKMFSPDIQMKSGETAVVAAFKQSSDDNERSGVGDARNWLFGGGISGKRGTTYVMIVLQPVVMVDRVPPASISVSSVGGF